MSEAGRTESRIKVPVFVEPTRVTLVGHTWFPIPEPSAVAAGRLSAARDRKKE